MPDLDITGGNMPKKPDSHEASMARADLYKAANYSFKLFKMIQDGQELEGWVQAKITKAADYIASVYHYMEYEMKFNDYGRKLEDSDIYTENVKQQFIQKLTEARVKLEKLRTKNKKEIEEDLENDRKNQWDKMTATTKKADNERRGTGKFDVKKTSTGTQYTRKSNTFTDGGKDKDLKKSEKKASESAEQPVGLGTRKVTGKVIPAGKAPGIPPQPKKIPKNSKDLTPQHVHDPVRESLKGGQKKLDANKNGKLDSDDFKKIRANKKKNESIVLEKSVSKSQQKFMGMVHAAKKGKKPASKEVAKAAKGMSAKSAKDFASTKHKGLPSKKS